MSVVMRLHGANRLAASQSYRVSGKLTSKQTKKARKDFDKRVNLPLKDKNRIDKNAPSVG